MRQLPQSVWQDLRFGLRLLRVNPGFALVAIVSLALGIGANAALFQLLDAVRLRALPVRNPQELVEIRIEDRKSATGNFTGRFNHLTNPLWEQLRDRPLGFAGVFAWGSSRFNLAESGETRYAQGMLVSGGFFETLGVRPLLGRVLAPADDRRGCADPGAVVSHAFWQRELGGDARALSRTLTLDGRRFPIVGVTPAGFFGVEVGWAYDVALPLCAEPLLRGQRSSLDKRDHWWLAAMGRLEPGSSAERASARLQAASRGIFEETLAPNYNPEDAKSYLAFKLAAFPGGSGLSRLRTRYETPLLLLLAIAALVLLIACANLANLMLGRAAAREREIAVRLAIGASRGRVVRQLLAESLLLAGIGAAAGVLVAQALSRVLVSFLTTQGSGLFVDLQPDARLLGFTAGLASLACVLFGLAPALRATRDAAGAALRASGRGISEGRERFNLRRALVTAQVALSLVLVVGALLFTRSLRNLTALDAGFRQHRILIMSFDLRRAGIPAAGLLAFQRELLERIRGVPGVAAAAQAFIVPVSGAGWNERVILRGVAQKTYPNLNRVTPGFFETMDTRLLAGRDFDERDTTSSPLVAIVNQSFARRILHRENPVGESFELEPEPGKPTPSYQVVGLVRDSKYLNLREDFGPIAFLPNAQDTTPDPFVQLLIRSDAQLGPLTTSLKRATFEQGPGIGITFQTLSRLIGDSLLRDRLMATLSGFFGGLAGLLATVGLYAVMSYRVACRRNEIGIRMAVGADRRDIVSMVLREAAALLGVGLAAGTVVALLVGHAASALLFGLAPSDPATLAAAALALASVAALASYLPAARAASLDPTAALRE